MSEIARNLEGLSDCGDVPFELLRPILGAASSSKLMNLEVCNNWQAQTQPLWQQLVARDYPALDALKETATQRDRRDWRKTYLDFADERRNKLAAMKVKLKGQYAGFDSQKQARQAKEIESLPVRKGGKGGFRASRTIAKKKMPPLFAKALKEAKGSSRRL